MKTSPQSKSVRVHSDAPLQKGNHAAWFSICLGIALLAILVGITLHPTSNITPGDTSEHYRSLAAPVATPLHTNSHEEVPSLALVPGDRLIYDFWQVRTITLQGSSFAGVITTAVSNHTVSLEIEQVGDFVVNVYGEAKDGWLVGLAMANPVVKMSSGDIAAPVDAWASELQNEIIVELAKNGRMGKVGLPENLSATALDLWRDILSRWQVVLAKDVRASHWIVNEQDGTGQFEAKYSKDSSQAKPTIRKEKNAISVLADRRPRVSRREAESPGPR